MHLSLKPLESGIRDAVTLRTKGAEIHQGVCQQVRGEQTEGTHVVDLKSLSVLRFAAWLIDPAVAAGVFVTVLGLAFLCLPVWAIFMPLPAEVLWVFVTDAVLVTACTGTVFTRSRLALDLAAVSGERGSTRDADEGAFGVGGSLCYCLVLALLRAINPTVMGSSRGLPRESLATVLAGNGLPVGHGCIKGGLLGVGTPHALAGTVPSRLPPVGGNLECCATFLTNNFKHANLWVRGGTGRV